MSSAFIQAAVILLREGLEAMLVIAALAGYLRKAGADNRMNALYGGALAAVGASIRCVASRYWETSVRCVRPEATIHQPTPPCSAPSAKIIQSRRFSSAPSAPRHRKYRNGKR